MSYCSPWITETDLSDCQLCAVGELAAGQAAQIIDAASQVLYLLSGQRFPGQCDDTVRPCNCPSCGYSLLGEWPGPIPIHYPSGWRNACGSCGGYCGATGAAILLPRRPVISILAVTVDGAAFSSWRLDSPGYLVRTDGSAWPTCQDITLSSAAAGTWEVSYLWGKMPPEALRYAATILSAELVKACLGDSSCRIPAGAVTVSRQGVTYDIDITGGRTGLYEVDLVLGAFNPGQRARRARLYSPDDVTWARTPVVGS